MFQSKVSILFSFLFVIIFNSYNTLSAQIVEKKIKIKKLVTIDSIAKETSGIIYKDGFLFTQNDDTDTNLYQFDVNGKFIKSLKLPLTRNIDWEEIQLFENYIYVGDIGNNSGKRKKLQIYKFNFDSINQKNVAIDTISFSYSEEDLNKKLSRKTNFDAEAFVVTKDSIFIFSKEWQSNKTSCYGIANKNGHHIAKKRFEYNVKGLITGAYLDVLNAKLFLCGYTKFLKPFVYVFSEFYDYNFFNAKIEKLKFSLPYYQIEAITKGKGDTYYLSNETFKRKMIANKKASILEFRYP